ncbi:response regulator [Endozoicomonas ascidiicola]|uniref:response regulator n=1 Tax=Endozoicomonas ascidiicola TaxID=1698521 RepID=UPI0008321C3A|nr:response regulator [Endozoicomonas ascidiicola]
MATPDTNLGLTILLAEDNPVNQMVTGKLLEKLGCHHVVANNGLECLKRLKDDQFDLILMDCVMPEMDGLEATRRIRASSSHCANIPIIALTASAMESDRQTCMNAGMDDYADKPIDMGRMKTLLTEWAQRINPES